MKVTHILVFITLLFNFTVFAKSKGVAKIIKARGKVYDTKSNSLLKKGMWLSEGSTIKTMSRSFIKLVFIDKSKMSIGPNSQVVINKFPKKKAGIITLMKGQLRSKVTKNYMQMNKKNSKLFIKTKTAAMGVRGTDFQVNFNPVNENTSLITFEGAVAMGAINELRNIRVDQDILEKVVSSTAAVIVKQGQFSGVMPKVNSKPLAPIKINSKQLRALEKNEDLTKKSTTSSKKVVKKSVRSIIPPGMNANFLKGASKKEILNEISKVDKVTASTFIKQVKTENKNIEQDIAKDNNAPKVQGGGIIDTNTVIYIPPPKNAAIDPMTNEPILPKTLGHFDTATGEYKNDYYNLNDDGQFAKKVSPSREIASINEANNEPLPPPSNILEEMKKEVIESFIEAGVEADIIDQEITLSADVIEDQLDERDEDITKILDGPAQTKTRTRLIITEE